MYLKFKICILRIAKLLKCFRPFKNHSVVFITYVGYNNKKNLLLQSFNKLNTLFQTK